MIIEIDLPVGEIGKHEYSVLLRKQDKLLVEIEIGDRRSRI